MCTSGVVSVSISLKGIMLLLVLISVGSLSSWLPQYPTDVWFAEHGQIENLQAAFLVIAMAAFLVRIPFTVNSAARMFYVGAALFCLSCTLREIDVEDLQVHDFWIVVGSGSGRNLILGAAWAAWIAIGFRQREAIWDLGMSILRQPVGKYFLAAAALVVAGALFDKGLVPFPNQLAWEEACELMGYGTLCFASHRLQVDPGRHRTPLRPRQQTVIEKRTTLEGA
jgi:hypothetical protein